MKWYLQAMTRYAQFSGRARRKEYWYFFLFNILIAMVLAFVDALTGTFSAEASIGALSGLYMLAVLVPGVAVTVRRLHDTNRSGWWVLIGLVPLLGLLLLVFTVAAGQSGENDYGPDPKRA